MHVQVLAAVQDGDALLACQDGPPPAAQEKAGRLTRAARGLMTFDDVGAAEAAGQENSCSLGTGAPVPLLQSLLRDLVINL